MLTAVKAALRLARAQLHDAAVADRFLESEGKLLQAVACFRLHWLFRSPRASGRRRTDTGTHRRRVTAVVPSVHLSTSRSLDATLSAIPSPFLEARLENVEGVKREGVEPRTISSREHSSWPHVTTGTRLRHRPHSGRDLSRAVSSSAAQACSATAAAPTAEFGGEAFAFRRGWSAMLAADLAAQSGVPVPPDEHLLGQIASEERQGCDKCTRAAPE